MEKAQIVMSLAETLERACRLASGLEGIMKDRACQNTDVSSAEYISWVLASELLYLLDEGRASMVSFNIRMDKVNHPIEQMLSD